MTMRLLRLVILSTLLAIGIRANAQIPGQGPLSGLAAPAETPFDGTYQEGFENITALMERYDGRGNVSLMKLGRVAMTMGKTVGKAGSAWTRKVAKAFKRVGVDGCDLQSVIIIVFTIACLSYLNSFHRFTFLAIINPITASINPNTIPYCSSVTIASKFLDTFCSCSWCNISGDNVS